MKVEVRSEYSPDYGKSQELWIDGKNILSVYPLCECPEDAIIGRALISCDMIAKLMQMAHAAGNEPFELSAGSIEDA